MTAAAATPTVTSPTKHWGARSPIHDSFQIWKIGRILFRVVAVVNVKLYRRRHYWNNYLIAVIFDICGSNLPSAGVSAASSCYCSQNHFVWAFLNRNYFRSCFVCFSFFEICYKRTMFVYRCRRRCWCSIQLLFEIDRLLIGFCHF